MSGRERAAIAAVACAVHLALLAPTVGQVGGVLHTDFGPEAIAIEAGELPYRDQELEYPPLAIPVIVGPALLTDGLDAYNDAFELEMLGFDLAIVLLLALALPGSRREVIGALAVYTAGIVALSGLVLGDSDIDQAPLALSRFDLVPACFALAAILARQAARSTLWSALLAIAVAVKGFPAVLFPVLLRGERRPGAVAVGAAIPLLVSVAIVAGFGDEFGSAIGYHAERELQIEAVAATPLEIAAIDDPGRAAEHGSGSFNYVGPGAELARAITITLLIGGYALVLWAGWRSRASHLRLSVALLAVVVTFAPILSPQFMFWLLPLSAAAFGLAYQNVILISAFVLTQLMLQFYARIVVDFDPEFVWRLAGRNAALLLYVAVVCGPIVRDGIRTARSEGSALPSAS